MSTSEEPSLIIPHNPGEAASRCVTAANLLIDHLHLDIPGYSTTAQIQVEHLVEMYCKITNLNFEDFTRPKVPWDPIDQILLSLRQRFGTENNQFTHMDAMLISTREPTHLLCLLQIFEAIMNYYESRGKDFSRALPLNETTILTHSADSIPDELSVTELDVNIEVVENDTGDNSVHVEQWDEDSKHHKIRVNIPKLTTTPDSNTTRYNTTQFDTTTNTTQEMEDEGEGTEDPSISPILRVPPGVFRRLTNPGTPGRVVNDNESMSSFEQPSTSSKKSTYEQTTKKKSALQTKTPSQFKTIEPSKTPNLDTTIESKFTSEKKTMEVKSPSKSPNQDTTIESKFTSKKKTTEVKSPSKSPNQEKTIGSKLPSDSEYKTMEVYLPNRPSNQQKTIQSKLPSQQKVNQNKPPPGQQKTIENKSQTIQQKTIENKPPPIQQKTLQSKIPILSPTKTRQMESAQFSTNKLPGENGQRMSATSSNGDIVDDDPGTTNQPGGSRDREDDGEVVEGLGNYRLRIVHDKIQAHIRNQLQHLDNQIRALKERCERANDESQYTPFSHTQTQPRQQTSAKHDCFGRRVRQHFPYYPGGIIWHRCHSSKAKAQKKSTQTPIDECPEDDEDQEDKEAEFTAFLKRVCEAVGSKEKSSVHKQVDDDLENFADRIIQMVMGDYPKWHFSDQEIQNLGGLCEEYVKYYDMENFEEDEIFQKCVDKMGEVFKELVRVKSLNKKTKSEMSTKPIVARKHYKPSRPVFQSDYNNPEKNPKNKPKKDEKRLEEKTYSNVDICLLELEEEYLNFLKLLYKQTDAINESNLSHAEKEAKLKTYFEEGRLRIKTSINQCVDRIVDNIANLYSN